MAQNDRYKDLKGITGQAWGQIGTLLQACFSDSTALENFVEQQFGRPVRHSINWDQAFTYACSDIVDYCRSHGRVGALLQALTERNPENAQVTELLAHLVGAGYLQDLQKPPRQSTNPHNTNWIDRYPTDYYVVEEDTRKILLDEMEACFTSADAIEGFLQDNFPSDYGKQLAHGIDRKQPVRVILDGVFTGFAKVRWLTAFVQAVQDYYNGTADHLMLQYFAQKLLVRPVATPAPTAVPAVAKPAPVAEPVKDLKVLSVSADLSHAVQLELRGLLVKAFNASDLNHLARAYLGEWLDHIVAPGSLNNVCEELIRWCVKEVKVPDLLNGMLKERARRTDIAAFVRKQAADGMWQIEG